MHIVYVIAPGGGPEAYLRTLAPWLIVQKHQVSIIFTGTQPFKTLMPERVKIYFARPRQGHYYLGKLFGKYRSWALRYRTWETSLEVERILLSLHRQQPIQVVELTEGYSAQRISQRFPVVVRAHGSAWAFRFHCQDDDLKWDTILIREQAMQFRSAHVVSPLSRHYSDFLSSACALPRSTFQEVPYPIDLDCFSPTGEMLKDAAPVSLMSIGRLEHRKGNDVAVQAMNGLWEKVPDACLYLLGSESQFTRSYLMELAVKDHHRKIIFPGFVSHSHLPIYYRSMKIYLALTQYETFGYTLLEAMACGIPVISCPVGAVPELIQSGVNGQLVPFGDAGKALQAITDLLQDPSLLEMLGRNARELSLCYALSKVGNQNLALYKQATDLFASA